MVEALSVCGPVSMSAPATAYGLEEEGDLNDRCRAGKSVGAVDEVYIARPAPKHPGLLIELVHPPEVGIKSRDPRCEVDVRLRGATRHRPHDDVRARRLRVEPHEVVVDSADLRHDEALRQRGPAVDDVEAARRQLALQLPAERPELGIPSGDCAMVVRNAHAMAGRHTARMHHGGMEALLGAMTASATTAFLEPGLEPST
eukprot:CAMPEP_0176187058 /NCGR_PEP_ID=MMETSP0121_2-20121125/2195_1 /TAXON_ID=160619 /ORGANISM="Kryptoperidinium foliaceum, Strain CCMP 1326" /LENGTH=200 /DNA_ID=CAMNT_0017525573 /DNA_START=94 /DNA_END=694 /DNA_ORIENTATION=-